ncbi:hypothetical protein VTN77DRAFT_1102 [Rasamsonia byssochlamydoides]|uniref:uncharacterized protein n=1 Tax=Rasamsonia byssochlamydoides TaxID=89139 RepID=UPI003742DFB0
MRADALFALDARQITEILEHGYDIASVKQKCGSLLESYTLLYEMKLVPYATPKENKGTTNMEQRLWSTELARLQRRLFRLEIYMRLFYVSQMRFGGLYRLDQTESAQEFVPGLPP